MDDLRELLKVGGTDRVHLVVLCDRSPRDSTEAGYSNERIFGLADWEGALLLEVGREQARVVEDWGEVNMAEGETLRRFVAEGTRRFPARRFGLVLSDHGQAWAGICSDDSAADPDDVLTLREIDAALRTGLPQPLELIGFDACLMASAEVALAVAPHARVMVASEELEPLLGWDYVPLARALETDPGLDGRALGKLALQAFRRSFERSSSLETRHEGMGSTLSLVDLERTGPLRQALDELGEAGLQGLRREGRRYWLALARARSRAEQYGSEGGIEDPGMALVDLGHLAALLASAAPDRPTAEAAAAAREAVSRAVLDQVHGEVRPEATGLSLFFPPDRDTLEGFPPAVYGQLPAQAPAWARLLEAYTGTVRDGGTRPLLADLARRGRRWTARAVEPEEVDRSWFVVLREEAKDRVVVGQLPLEPGPGGALREDFDGRVPVLGAGPRAIPCPLSAVSGPLGVARAQWSHASGPWVDVALHFDRSRGTLVLATVEGTGGRRPVRIGPGDRLRPVYLVFDEDGEADTAVYSGEEEILAVDRPEDLRLRPGRLPAGPYLAGFLLYDFDGDRDLEVRPVEVGE